MKLKDAYYRQNGYINTNCTQNAWLKNKDRFWRWVTNAYLKRVFGIELKPKRRHRRSFICCKLPNIVGNRIVYRLFKATVWYKAPNVKHRREEKYYQEEAYQERIEERKVL